MGKLYHLFTARIFETAISTNCIFASGYYSNWASANWTFLFWLVDFNLFLHGIFIIDYGGEETMEKTMKYFSKYPMFNAIVHASGGIAIGILVARPFDGGHPLQLAAIFAVIALAGHLVPLMMKKVK